MSNPAALPSASTLAPLTGSAVDDLTLYHRALTHRSCLRDPGIDAEHSNERLEYIGDAFLDLLVAVELYEHFPEENEGFLSRMRARLVSETPLANAARRCDLGRYLRLSPNAERNGGRKKPSILSDAFEAFTGALYLDRGHDAAAQFARRYLLDPADLETLVHRNRNYKSLLQERLQAAGRPLPTYILKDRTGPDHDSTFVVEVDVDGTSLGQGRAGSKKKAEQQAAHEALKQMHG
ncbi:ribonuclease III [Longimonas halophila]|uniref:Ribonuclease 3 n=1 Tax=Longimonas halophila TaxID=1469170 RepID=A0A2H3NY44_9BACT|nr:ribonuclease III [Longimonas halophila]PEN05462.1 ribonuclease III [Longimonas halophila]